MGDVVAQSCSSAAPHHGPKLLQFATSHALFPRLQLLQLLCSLFFESDLAGIADKFTVTYHCHCHCHMSLSLNQTCG